MKKVMFSIAGLAITGIAVASLLGATQVSAYQGDYTVEGPNHTEEREASMEQVMSTKDYEGWKVLMTEDGRTPGVLRKVDTQAEFDLFAQAYTLGKAGQTEEANAIRAELGLGSGQGRGGSGRGTHSGQGNNGASFVDANGNGTCDMME